MRSSTRRPRSRASATSENFDSVFARDQPAADGGDRRAPGGGGEAGVTRFVAQSYATIPPRTRGRAGEERGRSARPRPARDHARDGGGHGYLDRTVVDGGRHRAPLRRLLRRRQRRAGRARAQAEVPDRRRRRRHVVVRPPRGRRRGDRARARATARPAIYNVVDDEPAPVREWLPVLAERARREAAAARPVLARAADRGRGRRHDDDRVRGASNAKAKRELGWTPRYPSWRQGFAAAYARPSTAHRRASAAPARGYLARRRSPQRHEHAHARRARGAGDRPPTTRRARSSTAASTAGPRSSSASPTRSDVARVIVARPRDRAASSPCAAAATARRPRRHRGRHRARPLRHARRSRSTPTRRTAWAETGLTAGEYTHGRRRARPGDRLRRHRLGRDRRHHARRRRRLPGPQARPDHRQPAGRRGRHRRRRARCASTPRRTPTCSGRSAAAAATSAS